MSTAADGRAQAGASLDVRRTILAALPSLGMVSFWQVFFSLVPTMLVSEFGFTAARVSRIVGIGNAFGIVIVPVCCLLSDRCPSKSGRRTPFVMVGSAVAAVSIPLIALAARTGSLPLVIIAMAATMTGICIYRGATLAIIMDVTPRPLRTLANAVQKIVGFVAAAVMLGAVSLVSSLTSAGNYLPACLMESLIIAGSAIAFRLTFKEPNMVERMHQESHELGIPEEPTNTRVPHRFFDLGGISSMQRGLLVRLCLLAGFYYMAYTGMNANISQYAAAIYEMDSSSYVGINLMTILGAMISYIPVARLTMRVGRTNAAEIMAGVLTLCAILVWFCPFFSPALYPVFFLMGMPLGAIDICVYTMIVEMADSNNVGRYTGLYYLAVMVGQALTAICSGLVMDHATPHLFGYVAVMSVIMLLICEIASRDKDALDEKAGSATPAAASAPHETTTEGGESPA